MSNPKLVSIVLPTLNGETYLAQAIDSVLQQTYPHWELIIVDSYSDDSTPQIIADYVAQDSRIQSTQNPKENGRLPGALNAGFKLAKGDYYTWLSDDNEFRPTALETMVEALNQHPNVVLVYSDYTIQEAYDSTHLSRVLPPIYITQKNIITPSFLYRKEVDAQVGGYRPEYFLAEDYDFWLRALDYGDFLPIHEDLHFYRYHKGNLTAEHGVNNLEASAIKGLHWVLDHAEWTKDREKRGRIYLHLAFLARRYGNTGTWLKHTLQGIWFAPLVSIRRFGMWCIYRLFGKRVNQALSQRYAKRQGLSS